MAYGLHETVWHGLRNKQFTEQTAAELLATIAQKRLELGGLEAAYDMLRRQLLEERIRVHFGLHGFYGNVPIRMRFDDGNRDGVLVKLGRNSWGTNEPMLTVRWKLKSGKLSKVTHDLDANDLRFMEKAGN